jgi:hypothetical protein
VPSNPPSPGVPLLQLLSTLGPATVELASDQTADPIVVAGARIYDPDNHESLGVNDIVLAVNLDAQDPRAASVVAECGKAGAVAVAFKAASAADLHGVVGAASEHEVVVVRVEPQASWEQLHRLISTTVVNAGDDEATPLGDLFSLANAVAASIGGAVTIEDPRAVLLAYSNLDQPIDDPRRETILGRSTPSRWMSVLQELDIPRTLLRQPMKALPIHDDDGRARDRLAVCVTAGSEVLGSIWVVQGEAPFPADAAQLLEQMAPVAALHLLRHRASEDLNRSERAMSVHALLSGTKPAADVGVVLGVDPGARCAVVCFRLVAPDALDLVAKRARALDLVVLSCEALRRQVICAADGANVYALFPALSDAAEARLDAMVADLAERLSASLGVRVVAGIGRTVGGLAGARDSRAEADRVVRVLALSEQTAVARITQVEVSSVLLELRDLLANRPELHLDALDVLAKQDAEHGKPYLETLRVVAEEFWDVPAAARRLGMHSNSLRYRLRRIEELSGLDLDDPRHRLVVTLQFV